MMEQTKIRNNKGGANMAGTLGITTEALQDLSILIAGDTHEQKKITVKSGAGILTRGTVLSIDTTTYKYVQLNPDASDGTEVARAILAEDVDATDADVTAQAFFIGKYRASDLVWPDEITTEQKNAALLQLQDRGIIVE